MSIIIQKPPPNVVVVTKTAETKTIAKVGAVSLPVDDTLISHNPNIALSANMGRVLDENKFDDINTDLVSLYRLAKGE